MTNTSPASRAPLLISSSGKSITPIARVIALLPLQVRASSASDHSTRKKILHLGVIAGDLRDITLPNHVYPAVSGPYASKIAVEDEQNRNGCPDDDAAALTPDLYKARIGVEDGVLANGQ